MTRKWRLFSSSNFFVFRISVDLSMFTFIFTVLLLVLSSLSVISSDSDVYILDKSKQIGKRRVYNGLGGLSGGGATSKLLVNYPQEQRDQILDYLFKPLSGASLQILKVEIGGDAQSTDGTESSHMHNEWDENYFRGYEWWLMKEAKKRNSNILLYCLPWAFPAWIGDGTRSPYHNPQRTADYVVKYITGARKYHNLTMDYVGVWNERPYNTEYIETLRKTLNSQGLQQVKIVAADGQWEPISVEILANKDLAAAVDVIGIVAGTLTYGTPQANRVDPDETVPTGAVSSGSILFANASNHVTMRVHYPGTTGSAIADQTGKTLWSSEDYGTFNDNVGAGCWARILNQNFVNGNMTSTISWNLIASYYEALPFKRGGLMTADSPWSGHYSVGATLWMSAHTTNFVFYGWFYFPHGYGSTKLKKGGSMVSFTSFDNIHFTIVIETMSHDHSICIRPHLPAYTVEPQNVTFEVKGYSWVTTVGVYYSKLGFDGEPSSLFKKMDDLPVVNGTINLSLGIDEVYTLTTQASEVATPENAPPIPQEAPFPLPYQDTFESYSVNEEPYNFAPQVGVFETQPSADPFHKQVMTQVVLENPIFWCLFIDLVFPYGVIGNSKWYANGKQKTDIYVEADVHIGSVNASSGVYVAARAVNGGCDSFKAQGFFFFLFPDKGMIELSGNLARTQKVFEKEVTVKPQMWNNLGLLVHNGYVSGSLNGEQVFNIPIPDKSSSSGFVALGTADYGLAEFDNLKIMESKDGLRRMKRGEQGLLSERESYGPTFNRKPSIVDDKIKVVDKTSVDDNTLYYKPKKHG